MRKPDQMFSMGMSLTSSFEEYKEQVNTIYDDIPEIKAKLLEGLEDGPLVKPISFVEFHYPYHRLQCVYFDEQMPTTKHELFKGILAIVPDFLKSKPYSAPHAIEDFVVEAIDVYQFNDSYAKAYIYFGS